MSDKLISFCGLDCVECPAYIATQQQDEALLTKTAKRWSTAKRKIKPTDIRCDGCLTGQRLACFCSECPVRLCAAERGVENCGYCVDYPCLTLLKVWKWLRTPKAKGRLDEISQKRQ